MKGMMTGIGINPQAFPESPQLPAVVKIEGEFTCEESFSEYMREAFQTAGKQQFQTAPPAEVEIRGPEPADQELLAAYLLSMANPVIIDEQPKLTELETAAAPQISNPPELPGFSESPGQPEQVQTPETPQFTAAPEIPAQPELPEKPQNHATTEPPVAKTTPPLISEMKAPETPRILTTPETPDYVKPETPEIQQRQTYTVHETLQFSETPNYVKSETPEIPKTQTYAVPDTPIIQEISDKPQTYAVPETPEKSAVTQVTPEAKEFLEKLSQVKFAVESGKSVQISAQPANPESPEQPESVMKAWVTMQKTHVVIEEKPAELSELLENFKVKNPQTPEKSMISEKSEIPEKATEIKAEIPVIDPAALKSTIVNLSPTPVPLATTAEPLILSQSTITQVSEQITANLATAEKDGITTFEMILNPVELGKIAVKIVIQATGTAIEITAEKAATAQLLQNSADKIGLALEKGEAKLESFIVNVESKPDYSEQRNNQNSRGYQEQQADEDAEDDSPTGISFEELLQGL
jgi:flagellar hook-length control protein FliK